MKNKASQIISKIFVIAIFCLLAVGTKANAPTLELQIEILPQSKVSIKGKFLADNAGLPNKRWIFLDSYADARNLAARFSAPEFFGVGEQAVAKRKIAPTEFETTNAVKSFQYQADLLPPTETTAAAHVSWLTDAHGLLMFSDLLPQFSNDDKISARARFLLPAGWKIASVEQRVGDNEFSVESIDKAVFLVGKNFAERGANFDQTELRVAMGGEWTFSDEETLKMATQILEEHRRTFGELSVARAQLVLLPFPRAAKSDRWRAETRGSTIILLSGVTPFKSLALNRLHEQLRHEIFHLWIPNALNLSGQYDWFYEGFTLYQALKTGVKLEFIRFDDYLDTMSRAFDAAQTAQKNSTLSLLESSRTRWQGGSNLIYAKGMLIAFLCDVALLTESGGKKSLTDIFREIHQKHGRAAATERVEGNTAVIAALKKSKAAANIVQKFVEKPKVVEWSAEIAALGLQNEAANGFTKLVVSKKLNGRQKNLLQKLGFKRELIAD